MLMEELPSLVLYLLPIYSILMITMYIADKWDISSECSFILLWNIMTNFIEFLNGKKTTIGAILALIITYCLTKGYIDNDLAIVLNGILVALGLSVNISNGIKKK